MQMRLHHCLFSCPGFSRTPSHTDSVSAPWAAVLSISAPSSLQPSSHSTSTHLKRSFSKYPYSQKWLCTPGRDHILPDAHTPVKDLTWRFSSLWFYDPWCQLSFWTNSGLLPNFLLPFGLLSSFTGSLLLYCSIYHIILKMLFSGLFN